MKTVRVSGGAFYRAMGVKSVRAMTVVWMAGIETIRDASLSDLSHITSERSVCRHTYIRARTRAMFASSYLTFIILQTSKHCLFPPRI